MLEKRILEWQRERERLSKWADIGNEWAKMHHQRVEILKVGEHRAPCELLLGWNPRRSAKTQSGRNTGCPDFISRNNRNNNKYKFEV